MDKQASKGTVLGLGTWLDPEETCYPSGRWNRRGRVWFDGRVVPLVRAGIADTFFSIPGGIRDRGQYRRGFVTVKEFYGLPVFVFIAYRKETPCST